MRHSPQYDIPPDETSVGREAIAERISRLRPTTKALYERLRSSLTEKQIERLRAGRRCLVVVQAPDDGWESTVKHAFRAAVQEAAQDHDRRVAVQAWEASAPARHSTSIEDVLALLLSADVALMVTGEDATARSSVTTIADLVVHVPSFDPHFLLTLVAEKLGGKPEKWPDDWDATKLTPTRVDLALARAADPEEALAWLRIPTGASAALPGVENQGPDFQDLRGYGAAKEWGLRLVADVAAYRAGRIGWSDVARGLLLVGPPGTGKTLFAGSLARACGCTFLASSYSTWQSAGSGHLGDVTKAIRRLFQDAARNRPTLIFIDEIDSLPGRDAQTGHDAWWRAVVNCLLEQMDGIARHEGIVVVGACNDDSRLDPALVRAGRLDRTIRVELPDAEDLAAILRSHLAGQVEDEGTEAVATALAGFASGADAARIVRDARSTARSLGRSISSADLMAAAFPPDERSTDTRWRIAVHEAGHAIASMVFGDVPSSLSLVRISSTGGGVSISRGLGEQRGRDFEKLAVTYLAGRAAEEIVFGSPSAGAGGSEQSDLGSATSLLRMLVAECGLGPWLSVTGHGQEPYVESWMRRLYAEAMLLALRHRSEIVSLARLAMERRVLGRSALHDFAARNRLLARRQA